MREGKFVLKAAYNPSEENIETHKRFTKFAWAEADGNYIIAIKQLLDLIDYAHAIQELDERLAAVELVVQEIVENKPKEQTKKEEKKEPKAFGE